MLSQIQTEFQVLAWKRKHATRFEAWSVSTHQMQGKLELFTCEKPQGKFHLRGGEKKASQQEGGRKYCIIGFTTGKGGVWGLFTLIINSS